MISMRTAKRTRRKAKRGSASGSRRDRKLMGLWTRLVTVLVRYEASRPDALNTPRRAYAELGIAAGEGELTPVQAEISREVTTPLSRSPSLGNGRRSRRGRFWLCDTACQRFGRDPEVLG